MAGKQLETATGICILPHIDSVHVSNCDPGPSPERMAGVPPKKKSRVPNGTRDFR
jgi:hypothetical protein